MPSSVYFDNDDDRVEISYDPAFRVSHLGEGALSNQLSRSSVCSGYRDYVSQGLDDLSRVSVDLIAVSFEDLYLVLEIAG